MELLGFGTCHKDQAEATSYVRPFSQYAAIISEVLVNKTLTSSFNTLLSPKYTDVRVTIPRLIAQSDKVEQLRNRTLLTS